MDTRVYFLQMVRLRVTYIVTLEFLLVCVSPCNLLDCDEDWCEPFLAGL